MTLLSEHLGWISNTVLRAVQLAPPSLKIDIRIFVTGGSITTSNLNFDGESISSGSESGKKDNISDLLAHSSVTLTEGRPNIANILREEAEGTNGRMSVSGEYISTCYAGTVIDYRAIQCVARKRLRPPSAKECSLASLGRQVSCAGARASRCTSSPSATLEVYSAGSRRGCCYTLLTLELLLRVASHTDYSSM